MDQASKDRAPRPVVAGCQGLDSAPALLEPCCRRAGPAHAGMRGLVGHRRPYPRPPPHQPAPAGWGRAHGPGPDPRAGGSSRRPASSLSVVGAAADGSRPAAVLAVPGTSRRRRSKRSASGPVRGRERGCVRGVVSGCVGGMAGALARWVVRASGRRASGLERAGTGPQGVKPVRPDA